MANEQYSEIMFSCVCSAQPLHHKASEAMSRELFCQCHVIDDALCASLFNVIDIDINDIDNVQGLLLAPDNVQGLLLAPTSAFTLKNQVI